MYGHVGGNLSESQTLHDPQVQGLGILSTTTNRAALQREQIQKRNVWVSLQRSDKMTKPLVFSCTRPSTASHISRSELQLSMRAVKVIQHNPHGRSEKVVCFATNPKSTLGRLDILAAARYPFAHRL